MKRIGIAASKMAKGNLFLFNVYVILISSLFSLFLFIIAGCTIFFALTLIAYIGNEITSFALSDKWYPVFLVCMGCLTAIISIFTILLLTNNLKFSNVNEEQLNPKDENK